MIAKPGNKTAAPLWPDPYMFDCVFVSVADCVERELERKGRLCIIQGKPSVEDKYPETSSD